MGKELKKSKKELDELSDKFIKGMEISFERTNVISAVRLFPTHTHDAAVKEKMQILYRQW